MKSFFEEYGFVILAAIVVILLIAMATPIGDLVKIQVSEVVNSFGSKTQSKLNATDGIIQVRVSTANNKITLEWDANKKEDKFKYQYKASNTKGEANWTNKADVTANEKSRTVTIEKDSNDQPLTNKTKVEYKIYDSNDQLVASGIVTAKTGKNATTGGGTGGDPDGGSTENPSAPTVTLTAGQEIEIEGKKYTVIEQVEGNKYKVLATDLANSGEDKKFDDNCSNNYATSTIATYLDGEYYNNLPENTRNAIMKTGIQQKVSLTGYDNGKNSPTWTGETKDAGIHKVFLPSWDELTKAARSTDKKTLQTFVNGKYVWLRDTYDSYVLFVYNDGHLNNSHPNGNGCVRPAFVLDLSKVEYKKVN